MDAPPPHPLRARLARGETVLSLAVRMARGPEIGRIAATAGFDALYVDLEHSPLSLETAALVCTVAREAGVQPLVRVPGPRSELIGRVLDAGAGGVVVPHVDHADDARAALDAARFPPRGRRSYASGQPLLHFRPVPAGPAQAALDEACFVALMVESAAGVAAVDSVAAVPGIDLLFVGVQDLATDLGHPGEVDHPAVAAALARVHAAARAHGIAVGIGGLAAQPDLLRAQLAAGARFLSLGTDVGLLLGAASAQVRQARSLVPPAATGASG